MPDMLVKLYNQKEESKLISDLNEKGISLKKVLSPDRTKVLEFIKDNFNDNWVNECKAAFMNNPISCYVAVKDKKVIGFACYDATAKNYFGPTGVLESERGKGIGKALLNKCLLSMWENGYGYAIIGWTNEAIDFYKKTVQATVIENSSPGIYKRMIGL
ncbi:MAG: family N-acetyltransferase [Clostridiales bacterium]|jgi:GNAT superfamily N-acetyltransferase|nr:family N-acetyltransferase [Clostridiales bacterium]